jgi:hypothetical protein
VVNGCIKGGDVRHDLDLHVVLLELLLVVGLQQDSAFEADDGRLVGEDGHDVGATFQFLVEPFQQIHLV